MKHIERYLSAYVMSCIFGFTDETEMEYVYHVLETSGSVSSHPVLSKVLDFVRQGDPRSADTQRTVSDYVRSLVTHTKSPEDIKPKSDWHAYFHVEDGFATFLIANKAAKTGSIVMTNPESVAAYCLELEKEHPGITIKQI